MPRVLLGAAFGGLAIATQQGSAHIDIDIAHRVNEAACWIAGLLQDGALAAIRRRTPDMRWFVGC